MQVVSTANNAWLVESGPNAAALWAIAINPSTGALLSGSEKEQSVNLPAATVSQIAVSPDNTHVFVALGSSGTEIVVFAAGDGDPFGNIANIGVKHSAGAAVAVAVDPSNRVFYVGETAATTGTNTGGLRAFDYNSLAELTGSPYSTGGLAPYAILPAAAGSYVYVANRTVTGSSNGNIAAFSFTSSGTSDALTSLGSAVSAGTYPTAMIEDSLSNFILVINSGGNPDLDGYTMSSGVLTLGLSKATGTDPVQASAIAALP
jgi:DNA-binding beta-propeller fold protein YncE